MIPRLVKDNFKNYSYLTVCLHLEIAAGGSVRTVGCVELIIVAGQDGVEQDADDGGDGQTGQIDGDAAHHKGQAAHRVEAQRGHQNDSSNDQVAAVGEVHPVLDHVADTDGRDHAIQHEADAADDAGGDGVDDCLKLGAEAQDDGQHRSDADDQRVVDAAQRENAGVLAVGGVGRAAQQAGHGGRKAVAHQGAVQAGVVDIVVADGGADGSDITDVLHHGGQCDGQDGEEGADELRAAVDGEQAHGVLMQRDAEPVGGSDGLEIHGAGHESDRVGDQNTDEDGQDLDHALAPDVADDDRAQCHKGQQPVRLTVGDGRGRQDQADGDDDGARDHRREELHDAADAEGGDEQADHQIQDAGKGNACAGIGQHLRVGNGQVAVGICQHGGHDRKAAQIGKRRAKKSRDLASGDQMEQQCAQTCAEQRSGNAQARQQRHQHRGTEHGEHVLYAEDQHPTRAQLARVVNAFGVVDFFTHKRVLLSRFTSKKRGIAAKKRQCLSFREEKTFGTGEQPPCSAKSNRAFCSPLPFVRCKVYQKPPRSAMDFRFFCILSAIAFFFRFYSPAAAFCTCILQSGPLRTIIIPIKWIEI